MDEIIITKTTEEFEDLQNFFSYIRYHGKKRKLIGFIMEWAERLEDKIIYNK